MRLLAALLVLVPAPAWPWATEAMFVHAELALLPSVTVEVEAWPGGGAVRVEVLNGTPADAWVLIDGITIEPDLGYWALVDSSGRLLARK